MLRLARWSPAARAWGRRYHEHHITDNMRFITKQNDKITVDPSTLRITRRVQRPICLQLNWMSATAAQTRKYTGLVLDQLDVVAVQCEVRHVLLPESGVQRIALDLLRLMSANDATYVLYGLSAGAYLWSEALVHAARDPQYRDVIDRVAAQIWDSISKINRTPSGIAVAMFPNLASNKLAMRWASYVCDSWYRFYLKSCYSSVTVHYERAAEAFLHTACRAPALVLHAANDEIAPWQYARGVYDAWTENGIKASWKCWERSNHVAHYLYHPREYTALVRAHLRHVPGLAVV